MSQGWYVSVDGKTTGPLSTQQVIEGIQQNRIPAEATVCAAGLTRFRKITEEPELAKAFAPAAAPASCATGKCCPMPRVVAATTLLASTGLWAAAALHNAHHCAKTAAGAATPHLHAVPCHYLAAGVGALVAFVALFSLVGIIRRKPGAHCTASALHVAGLGGSLWLAHAFCPGFLILSGLHVLGLLSTRVARKQACGVKTGKSLPTV